ncbi:hypothetical protein GP486_007716 [Trichoglossum hirsutum]|uniref:Uncharacterized protein n=1 Tax=Trichoglossum hirsutum TaxID=265104 RepID=A0A9P8IC96_9PEZI|nr:hypothetical protein GP486_007716 [Trichoglossum hirsutum]
MSPDQYRTLSQVLLTAKNKRSVLLAPATERSEVCSPRSILDDRDAQGIKVAQITRFPSTLRDPFDLLECADFKAPIGALFPFDEESHQHRPL